MRYHVPVALLCCSVTLFACQDKELDPEIISVHASMTTALGAKDKGELYRLSPSTFHKELDLFYVRWKAAVERVRREYPTYEKDEVLQQLGAATLDSVKNGKSLFIQLIDLWGDGLGHQTEVEQGLEIADHVVKPDHAVVTTKAGEVFEYIREDGGWRSSLLHNQWKSYASVKAIEANINTVQANLDSWRVASRETTDPQKPAGAFNTIIHAIRKGYRMTVYTVLSPKTKAWLKQAAADATTLRKDVSRHFPKAAKRHEFLVQRKIEWTERVTDGRSLFAILWDTGRLKMDLKLGPKSKVQAVLPGDTGNVEVVVRTGDHDERFTMAQQPDGLWKLTSLEAPIRAKAVDPIKRALNELEKINAPTETVP